MDMEKPTLEAEALFAQEWELKENTLLDELGGDFKLLKPRAWLIPNSLGHNVKRTAIQLALEDIRIAKEGNVSEGIIIRMAQFGLERRAATRNLWNRKEENPISLADLGLE